MIDAASEMVVLVDEHDNDIGSEEKIRAHSLGLLHRAFSVFIVRKVAQQIEVLLQRRQQDKYHCGGLWTNTCCSHPRVGENIIVAGERRLQEEMGLKIKLQQIGAFTYRAEFSNGLIEHEYDHTLLGIYSGDEIRINPAEVQAYRWIELEALRLDLNARPEDYTPWLSPALNIVLAKQQLLQEI